MSVPVFDGQFVYVPLYQDYAARVGDEMPDRPWTDPVGWSTALRQTADLVGPDVAAVSGVDALAADLETADGADLASVRFDEALGPGVEGFAETIGIVADVRSEPVGAVLPSPATVCVDQLGADWLDAVAADEFAALDALHEAGQAVTDVIRSLEGTVDVLLLDERGLETARDRGLSLDDALLEAGAVFNTADHHGLRVVGRFPSTLRADAAALLDEYDVVTFEALPPEAIESLADVSGRTGGSLPAAVWSAEPATFESRVESFQNALPEGFVWLVPVPATAAPERVQRFRELLGR
jgi:hypothetical protein